MSKTDDSLLVFEAPLCTFALSTRNRNNRMSAMHLMTIIYIPSVMVDTLRLGEVVDVWSTKIVMIIQ